MKNTFKLISFIFFVTITMLLNESLFANNEADSIIQKANDYVNIGNNFLSKGNYKQAEINFKNSVNTWNQLNSYHEYSAWPHLQLASLYQATGDHNKSVEEYSNAEKILANASDSYKYLLGGLYNNIGFFYSSYGDYQKSLEYYTRALKVIDPIKTNNENLYADALIGVVQCLYFQRKYYLAIDVINKHLKKNIIKSTSFKFLLGNTYNQLREYDNSIKILKEVVSEYNENTHEYSQSILNLANAYVHNNNLIEAERCLNKALPLLEEIKYKNDPWMVYYYEIYGQYLMKKAEQDNCDYNKLADYTEAVNVFDNALIHNSRNKDHKIPYLEGNGEMITPTQVKDVFVSRTKALNEIGNIYTKQNDQFTAQNFYDRALNTADATTRFLHDLRISFLNEESKISLTEQYENVYLDGFKIAENLHSQTHLPGYFEKMLKFSESGKSATFLASLNDIKAKNFGGIPDSLVQIERNITMQLSNLKQLKFNEENQSQPDSGLISELDKSIFNLQNQHDELIFLFEHDYADFYKFKYQNVSITANEIIDKLQRNQALIEYFVDEPDAPGDTGYVYSMTFNSLGYSYHKELITYEYIQNLQTVIGELTNNKIADTNTNDFIDYTTSANYLFNKLIGPLKLGEKITDLIVIPDGKLSYLPFDALLTKLPEDNNIDYRKLRYLVYDYNISYSYSATLHFDYFKSNKKSGRNILAFAPDYTDKEVDLNKTAYRNRQARAILRPLPGAREEVIGLSKFQKCRALFNSEANETNFKEMARNYDILHLAMHTIINDSIPMFSKLVFSIPEDTIDDGYLNTQEIYNLKLDARLTVLSACNTGSGQMRTGEGVMSLSRAFLYAGCPSIVMTLWEVEDKVSAELMLNFYQYLFKGYSKSEALRKAKMDHIRNADPLKAHPYFWQGYILVGDPSPIKFNNNALISILIFSVGLILLWHFIRKFYKTKKKVVSKNNVDQ